jgi:hypothetical protein
MYRGETMAENIQPQLLSPEEAAELIAAEREDVYHWIAADKVPFVELPGQRGEYRIPMHGFLQCISELYDLPGALRAIDEAIASLPQAERDRLQEGL